MGTFSFSSHQEWAELPGTVPVNEPQDPGPFALGGRVTASEIAVGQKNYEEDKKKYNNYQTLKRILRNHLVDATEPEYLNPIQCEVTDTINQSIPDICLLAH